MGKRERLDSWKEVAAYLRRGARTVQRWEREQGLPVHRLQHDKLGSVYAYTDELDAWWESRRTQLENPPPAAPCAERSIAVLPFMDMTREKDQDYLCEGLAEEIITALSKVHGLRVASRSSSFCCRGGAQDARETGRRLQVKTLLEGSVRQAQDRLRIAVQLIDAETGFQQWSAAFNGEMKEIFELQEEIAGSVAGALQVKLSAAEKEAIAKSPTRDIQAYECYLRGRKFYYGYGPQDMEFAIQLFVRAIALDVDFVMAYAGLADCWSYLYLYSDRSEAVREQADWASAKAVELDPESAQAHASRGLALSLQENSGAADAEFDAAIRLDPNLFEAHYFSARHAFAQGRREDAIERYEEAMRVRPEDFQAPLLIAQIYEELGEQEKAREARTRGIALARRHLEMNPDDARAVYMAANGMVALGQRELGVDWVRRALRMRPDDPMLLYNAGCVYAMAGAAEEAVGCLERAVEHGLTQKGWFEHDNNLDGVRANPRFKALLRKMNGPGNGKARGSSR